MAQVLAHLVMCQGLYLKVKLGLPIMAATSVKDYSFNKHSGDKGIAISHVGAAGGASPHHIP